MKKIVYVLIAGLTLILVACNSNEKNAKKLIKDYLNKNLNDASSYEPVEFSKLDSTFSNFYFSSEGEKLTNQKEFAHNRAFELQIEDVLGNNTKIQDSIKIYNQIEEESEKLYREKEKNYKGEFIGWKMTHKYRAKNGLGAKILGTSTFTFNKDITEIKNVTEDN